MKNLAIMLVTAFALVSCYSHRDHYYYENTHPQHHPVKPMPKPQPKKHHPKKDHKKHHPKKYKKQVRNVPYTPAPVGPRVHR